MAAYYHTFRRYFQSIFVAMLIVSLGPASLVSAGGTIGIPAVNGLADLSGWDFREMGPVSLTGDWQFFWQTFKAPGEIDFQHPGPSASWIPVPGPWNRYEDGGKPPGGQGFGTLALRVTLGKHHPPLSLYIHEIQTAYDLYINGNRVIRTGRIGENKDEMIPEYRPAIIDISAGQDVLDITIHIANFRHRFGGPWSKIILGTETELRRSATYRLVTNVFMMGSIFIMGLYHLSLYFLRKRYTPPLYLGLFCCLITIRALVTNERYLHVLFPQIPWEILLKVEYLGFYLAVPAFALFSATLFPNEFSKKVCRVMVWTALAFSLAVILFPAGIYSHTALTYEILTLAACGYLFTVFVKAVRKRREGIWAIILGFTALFACIVNDILYANNVIKTAYFLQAGMFVFIFSHAFTLALRFSRTFREVERQTAALTREIRVKEKLEASLVESHDQFKSSRIALILGLAKLAEYRDTDTGAHLERIREYARMIAADLAETAAYKAYITPDYVEDIYHSAILHDIGKIGIKDDILLKPGKLTPGEFEIMKTHTLIGGDAITEVAAKVKIRSFLTLGKDIAYFHHERWDGTGYPRGLSGTGIPLSARITTIADVYDALTSERPYKKAFSHDRAVDIISRESGTQFDPDIVAAFLRLSDKIKAVRDRLGRT